MSKKDQILEEEIPQEPDAGPSSFFPEPGAGMGKEVKIGVAVILGLLTVFGVVLVKKFRHPPEPPAIAEEPGGPPQRHAREKGDPMVPPPGGPMGKAKELMPPASHSISTTGPSASSPPWTTVGSSTSPKGPGQDNRPGAAPPNPMPKAPDITGGPGAGQLTPFKGSLDKNPPPMPPSAGALTTKTPAPADKKPFDPFHNQSAMSGFGKGPSMGPPNEASGKPGPALAANEKERMERRQRPGGPPDASGMSLDLPDPADPGSKPAPRDATPPRGAVAYLDHQHRSPTPPPPTPDTAVPPPIRDTDSSPRERPRRGPDFSNSSLASAGAGYLDTPSVPPPPRSHDDHAGPRPDGTYVVRPNDSYWLISKRLYGTDGYFRALAEHNRNKFPNEDRLAAGDVISVPSPADLQRNYPNLCPKPDSRPLLPERSIYQQASMHGGRGRTYVVQEGDNLFNIAKYELHSASRWVEIYELNRGLLGDQVDRLKPGMRLAMPDAPGPSPRTANQESGVRR